MFCLSFTIILVAMLLVFNMLEDAILNNKDVVILDNVEI